jgi:hypothetical protein
MNDDEPVLICTTGHHLGTAEWAARLAQEAPPVLIVETPPCEAFSPLSKIDPYLGVLGLPSMKALIHQLADQGLEDLRMGRVWPMRVNRSGNAKQRRKALRAAWRADLAHLRAGRAGFVIDEVTPFPGTQRRPT